MTDNNASASSTEVTRESLIDVGMRELAILKDVGVEVTDAQKKAYTEALARMSLDGGWQEVSKRMWEALAETGVKVTKEQERLKSDAILRRADRAIALANAVLEEADRQPRENGTTDPVEAGKRYGASLAASGIKLTPAELKAMFQQISSPVADNDPAEQGKASGASLAEAGVKLTPGEIGQFIEQIVSGITGILPGSSRRKGSDRGNP